jgi:PAS domain S-box-containing protein
VQRLKGQRRNAIVPGLVLASALLTSPRTALALDPPLQIAQYAHTSWTARDGYALGLVFAMAQTPDGYLWLGGSFGLFRFDGVRFVPWQPPAGESLPSKPYSLLVSRDGTLWIGTFNGLVSWDGTRLTHYPQTGKGFVTSLLEDRDGTIWAGELADHGRLCAVRHGQAQCDQANGGFGTFVWSLAEDRTGALWAGAESGLWRWRPGPPQRIDTAGRRLGDLITTSDGQLLIGLRRAGLARLAGDKLVPYAVRSASPPAELLPDRDIQANKLLRDRDGGVWIGTDGRGLIHVQDGKADTFTKTEGLSGNIACSLLEDREGNIWFASERGLDRFRRQAVTTMSVQQGLANDSTRSVLATQDGSIWVATTDGLTRWKDGTPTTFKEREGLPDPGVQSLYQDAAGRLWVSTSRGLAYFANDRFVKVDGLTSREVYSMSGDETGDLWLSGTQGLARLHQGRFVEVIPWRTLGRWQQAKVIVADRGGLWMGFWQDGGVLYFKDGKVQATYTAAQGLGAGHIGGLRLAADGAVWAATEDGGLSRIKDGRITTLAVGNGLPCNAIHWSTEDDSGALWMYTACGLVRVGREDLQAWIADPHHKVTPKVWGAADGVMLLALSPAYFNPPVAKAADGKLWAVWGDGVQVFDPAHLASNTLPPPVHIENLIADRKPYAVANNLRLPPLVRDITIEFTALSLVDPKNMQFRYRLEGHDTDWQEAIDRRQATYTNLPPGRYRFRVKAANNNGVWNEQGAQLDFLILPAFYQTTWFRLAAAVLFIGLVWSGFQLRLYRLRRERERLREVIKEIPAMAFSVNPDGSADLVNPRWLDYTGESDAREEDHSWGAAIHPEDAEEHLKKWRAALATGMPFENEARHRNAAGEYRWFLVQAVPLRDRHGKVVKWYGTLTDIEERKRAEEERERLRRLESHLAHTNRVSMLGELTASLAHEINQPIAAMMVSAGAGLRWLDREQPELQRAREAIQRIKDDGKRAADIIAGLKAFYRKDGSTPRALLDVNEVVREMLVLLHHEAEQHSVVMRTELARNLPPVRADRVQLQQVLMNLMVNGMEAMGETGGVLLIRTQPAEGGLAVSVSDTGVGIPADKIEHIFSAFVTSKAAGTGMGLAISRTIVESHGGRLWAESDPGAGATFHFTLPAASDATAAQPPFTSARPPAARP